MLFSILLFDTDESVAGMTHEEEEALMNRHFAVQAKLVAEGRLGPVWSAARRHKPLADGKAAPPPADAGRDRGGPHDDAIVR